MINVSNEFKELMEVRTNFKQYAKILLNNGTTLTLDDTQFTASNNYIVDGAGLSTIPLGVAVQKNIQIEIINDSGQYSDADFYGATVSLYLDFSLSSTTERIKKGSYTVLSPATYGDTVIITAVDDMHLADIAYQPTITFPATAAQVLADICQLCGILKGNISFNNDSFVIQSAPQGTCRQIIGYIAMLACGNARINNNGELDIIPYDFTGFDTGNYHTLKNFTYPKFETSDVSVTGVKMVVKGETADLDRTVIVGSEGYVLTVENPLVEGQEDVLLTWLYETFSGAPIRPFSGDMISNPLVEFMDLAKVVDRHRNEYNTVITDVNFQVLGYTTVKNTFPNAIQMSSTYPSDAVRVEQLARKWVEYERQSRQEAVKKLNEDLAASSGLYQTDVEQADGSTISYFHDKPTLGESKNVLKITSEAIGISNDGGVTYHGGFTFDAETVMKFIETEGLEADWVKVGSKTITTVIDENVSNLQAQIDNNIESHYYDYAPTLENEPAASWTTEEDRKKHEGDLFFDKSTGYKYRFFSGDSGTGEVVWEWRLIKDTDITSALQSIKEVETNLSVFEGEITASVEETNKMAENAQKTASEVKVAVGNITLVVTGSDGTQAELKIGSDGKINLTGDVIAQKIFTDLLMAQNLKATGSFQVDNGAWQLIQGTSGLIIRTTPTENAPPSAYINIAESYANISAVNPTTGRECHLRLEHNTSAGDLSAELGNDSAYVQVGDGYVDLVGDEVRLNSKSFAALFAEKAPSGYGLGGICTAIDSWDNALNNGFYFSGVGGPVVGSYFQGIVINYGTSVIVQKVWKTWDDALYKAERRQYNGVWKPWEWVNPPLLSGTEYRTTERYRGRPVYIKVVNFGALPNATYKSVSHGIENMALLVYKDCTAGTYHFPVNCPDSPYIGVVDVYANATSIQITSSVDWSDVNGYVKLKYTKTTD